MAINFCRLHHTCLDSRPQLNTHWLIKLLQSAVSAKLNEANMNISNDATVKGMFYIKMLTSTPLWKSVITL